MWGKIRLDKSDAEFSKYIRLRDGACVRCGKRGTNTVDGLPIKGLQCSHYLSRGRENTRFDPENCDALCAGCHQHWGSADKEGYRDFKLKQLGQEKFNLLLVRGRLYCKRDRKMALIRAKVLLEELKKDAV